MLCLLNVQTNAIAACTDALVSSASYASGESIPYILTAQSRQPKYAVVLMPGSSGRLEPEMRDGKLHHLAATNFLIRSRKLFCDNEFIAISTDSTGSPERMLAIIRDVEAKFGKIKTYVIGTSKSTYSTIQLSEPLDAQVAGFIHTSSMNSIVSFDPRAFKSRHLIVHHKEDICKSTLLTSAEWAHKRYDAELLIVEGGISVGDQCGPSAHHGYNGIEKETVDKIKAWIKKK